MVSQNELKAAAERLMGHATAEDRRILQQAMLGGRLTHSEGDNSVAIGGDLSGSTVATGAHAQIFNFQLGNASYDQWRELIFPKPPGIVPPFPDLLFIGRNAAMADVKALLGMRPGTSAQSHTAVVRGWPGVGKTTLISVLSRDTDVSEAYPDGVLWTSLDQNPRLMSIFAAWGRTLGQDDLLSLATPQEAVQQLAAILHQKRMLLIVDDVWDAGHAAYFMQTQGPQCGLLVTTRLPEVAQAIAQKEESIYSLPVLTEEDSINLMRLLAREVVDQYPKECHELVNDLECLPLALHVAARLLRAESKLGWGVTELLTEIRAGAAIIKAQAPADRAEAGNIPSVQALLQKSTDMLDELTRECFAFLGAFAPKPATFNLAAMKAVWEVEDPKPFVRTLVGHGLLEPVAGGRFQMHALLVAHAISLCEQ
jgi:hypothetical protein